MAIFGKRQRNTSAPEQAATSEILTPIRGSIVALADVPDPVFAKGTMGKGIAVVPSGDEVRAPIAGTVLTAFPTGHAYGIRSGDGVEVLVHVGIDTVKLDGRGFTLAVQKGQSVAAGDLLATVDLAVLAAEKKDPTTVVVVTNAAEFVDVVPTAATVVELGDAVLTIKR